VSKTVQDVVQDDVLVMVEASDGVSQDALSAVDGRWSTSWSSRLAGRAGPVRPERLLAALTQRVLSPRSRAWPPGRVTPPCGSTTVGVRSLGMLPIWRPPGR